MRYKKGDDLVVLKDQGDSASLTRGQIVEFQNTSLMPGYLYVLPQNGQLTVVRERDVGLAVQPASAHDTSEKMGDSKKLSCAPGSHAWTPYVGLTEGYDYCVFCDKKRQVGGS